MWTNERPTSNFPAQSVILSQSIENFDYIEIIARISTANATEVSTILIAEEVLNMTGNNAPRAAIAVRGTLNYARVIGCVSNTSIQIGIAVNVGATGTSEGMCIPIRISGLTSL